MPNGKNGEFLRKTGIGRKLRINIVKFARAANRQFEQQIAELRRIVTLESHKIAAVPRYLDSLIGSGW